MTRALMFQGTGSDVGKTVLVAGLCRALTKRGYKVRPFKPQNMSNNAAVTKDGGEIGRAQWLQAFACNVAPSVHMNPVLLKPESETGSQVVVHGKVFGKAKGRDYQALKPKLLDAVLTSFEHLSHEADFIFVEGAGSPAEINLRKGDIANMGFARAANVPVILVGDIDRGGVIASIVGTHSVVDRDDRAMIVGYLINKFRGDVSLFDEGLLQITAFTGWPSFGVVPWQKSVARLPAEDSVALETLTNTDKSGVKIAVPMLGRIANFDDFDALGSEPGVDLVFVRPGDQLPRDAALIILPGSKSTIADLAGFRAQGWDKQLAAHVQGGGAVMGICGGYQMLGRVIDDPQGLEGAANRVSGLGLLDVETVMEPEKTVRQDAALALNEDLPVSGYEIHIGRTTGPDCDRPLLLIEGRTDGAHSADGKIIGTYMHGIFDNGAFRRAFLARFGVVSGGIDRAVQIDEALDELAHALEAVLDIDGLIAAARVVEPRRHEVTA